MTVNLVVSKAIGTAEAADSLAGGGSGIDLGSVVNGEYTPIILKSNNTGWQNIFVRHDAVTDPITNVKTFIGAYSQAYGGAISAPGDFTTLQTKGAGSSTSANNADGLGAGLRVEMDSDLGNTLGASAFDATRAQCKIYGAGGLGVSLATGYTMHADAAVFNSGGSAIDATGPVAGKIGKAGDTVLGDNGLLKTRYYLESAATNGGIIQWDWIVAYAFTA